MKLFSITPNGDKESLIPLTQRFDNLLVLRSLQISSISLRLRLGYVIGSSKTLKQWNINRDPWPLNSFAIKGGIGYILRKTEYIKNYQK